MWTAKPSPLALGLALLSWPLAFSACGDPEPDPVKDPANPAHPPAQHEALGPGSNTAPYDHEMTVAIPFSAQIGNQPVSCGARYAGVGLAKSEVELEELALYVHKVELRNTQGQWVPLRLQDDGHWQSQGVALLDFLGHESAACSAQGTAETHTYLSGYIPKGEYNGLRYVLGVPGVLNHIDASTATSPFNRQRMWWTWARGYRYIKVDLKSWTTLPDQSIVHKPRYFSHSGADKCTMDPASQTYSCQDPRLVQVELDHRLGQDAVVVDLSAYLSRDDLSKGRGCMGARSVADVADPEGTQSDACLAHYLSMGLDPSGEIAVPTGAQDLFHSAPWTGTQPVPPPYVPLSQADTPEGRKDVTLWPRMDYVRPAKLDAESSVSAHLKTDSHPFDDPRAQQSCASCHQRFGPGKSMYAFGGTIFRQDGRPYDEGFIEIVSSTGKANRREPDPSKKLSNPKVHMRVPIDAHGQFYVTQDLANQYAQEQGVEPLNFAGQNYQAYTVNKDGHRIQAMAVSTTGSCNHCHTGGFKLVVPDRLLRGPWTPEPKG